jgi:hypothetical protein
MVPLPDLVIDAIGVSWNSSDYCTGVHQALYNVQVKLRNAGAGPAVLPSGKSWVVVWSVLGSIAGSQKTIGQPPAQLNPGQTIVLKTPLQVIMLISRDKKTSTVNIGVIADPDKVIKELDENNNTRYQEVKTAAELCPEK